MRIVHTIVATVAFAVLGQTTGFDLGDFNIDSEQMKSAMDYTLPEQVTKYVKMGKPFVKMITNMLEDPKCQESWGDVLKKNIDKAAASEPIIVRDVVVDICSFENDCVMDAMVAARKTAEKQPFAKNAMENFMKENDITTEQLDVAGPLIQMAVCDAVNTATKDEKDEL